MMIIAGTSLLTWEFPIITIIMIIFLTLARSSMLTLDRATSATRIDALEPAT